MKVFKKGYYFAALVALCIASTNVIASGLIKEREVLLDDSYGGQHQIKQKVYDDGDGFYTFIRGGRPDELVEIHKRVCESAGAEDAFDEGTIMISEDVIDVVVCHITDVDVLDNKERESPKSSGLNGELVEESTVNTIGPKTLNLSPSLSIFAPSANVRVGVNYYLNGYANYQTVQGGFYSNEMWIDRCRVANSGVVGANRRGSFELTVLCRATSSGTRPVYFASSIPGLSGRSVGQVTAR